MSYTVQKVVALADARDDLKKIYNNIEEYAFHYDGMTLDNEVNDMLDNFDDLIDELSGIVNRMDGW